MKEFIQWIISPGANSSAHCQDEQDASVATGAKCEGTIYVIMLCHSQQAFCIAENQFLNQDHHEVLDSNVKPHHMPRNASYCCEEMWFVLFCFSLIVLHFLTIFIGNFWIVLNSM